jgi:hypothetical protein
VQADILNGGPDDGETTGFRSEHVDLIRALAHIAEKALNGIGGLDMPMHALGEVVKPTGCATRWTFL